MRSRTASDVLLDASVLCRFAKHGLLQKLRDYLGDRAHITPDVERELLRLSARSEFRQLHDYLAKDGGAVRSEGKWPKRTKNLPDALKPEFSTVLELKRAIGEHERAHAGEINVLTHARSVFPSFRLYGAMGGLHLSGINEKVIPETVADLKTFGLKLLAPGHCTGWRALSVMAREFGNELVPSAVGKRYLI